MDIQNVILELTRRYPNGSPYSTLDELIAANQAVFCGYGFLQTNQDARKSITKELTLVGILMSASPSPVQAPQKTVLLTEQEQLEHILRELQKRYPSLAAEGTLGNLKKANPDLDWGALSSLIKRVTGMTPRTYFEKKQLIVPTKLVSMGLEHNVVYRLHTLGIHYIGELMKLSDGEIDALHTDDQGKADIRNIIQTYRTLYNIPIEKLAISRRALTVLQRAGITLAHQLMSNYQYLPGIGYVSAAEIQKALKDYIAEHLSKASANTQNPNPPQHTKTANTPTKRETEKQKKLDAEKKLKAFTDRLHELYPPDSKKESLLVYMRRNNPDLPLEEAAAWCWLLYKKPLKNYLAENGLLVPQSPAQAQESSEKAVEQKPQTKVPAQENIATESTAKVPVKAFSQAHIDTCLQRDTEGFQKFTEDYNLPYTMGEAYGYIRTLHRQELSAFLKQEKGISYAEYLISHGLIPAKPAVYWKTQLLEYLQKNYLQCSSGMLIPSQASFELDNIRGLCKISAPIFEGYNPIPMLRAEMHLGGTLAMQPCYGEENYACDVALTANGNVIGHLNRTLFRSTGLGVVLFSALHAGAAVLQTIKISQGEYLHGILEFHFLV